MGRGVSRVAAKRGRMAAGALIALVVAGASAGGAAARDDLFLATTTFSDGFSLSPVDTRAFTVDADELAQLSHDGATLEISAGALSQTSTIRISGLPPEELPRLEQGMANVTGLERVTIDALDLTTSSPSLEELLITGLPAAAAARLSAANAGVVVSTGSERYVNGERR